MLRAGLLAVVIAAFAAPAAEAQIVGFQTPSGNIHCAYIAVDSSVSLRCDVLERDNAPPPKPRSCDADWGTAFGLTARGRGRRLCVSDAVTDPSNPVLGYGRTWRRGPFTCRSRQAYLRCTNRRAHGFKLSRQRQTVF